MFQVKNIPDISDIPDNAYISTNFPSGIAFYIPDTSLTKCDLDNKKEPPGTAIPDGSCAKSTH